MVADASKTVPLGYDAIIITGENVVTTKYYDVPFTARYNMPVTPPTEEGEVETPSDEPTDTPATVTYQTTNWSITGDKLVIEYKGSDGSTNKSEYEQVNSGGDRYFKIQTLPAYTTITITSEWSLDTMKDAVTIGESSRVTSLGGGAVKIFGSNFVITKFYGVEFTARYEAKTPDPTGSDDGEGITGGDAAQIQKNNAYKKLVDAIVEYFNSEPNAPIFLIIGNTSSSSSQTLKNDNGDEAVSILQKITTQDEGIYVIPVAFDQTVAAGSTLLWYANSDNFKASAVEAAATGDYHFIDDDGNEVAMPLTKSVNSVNVAVSLGAGQTLSPVVAVKGSSGDPGDNPEETEEKGSQPLGSSGGGGGCVSVRSEELGVRSVLLLALAAMLLKKQR